MKTYTIYLITSSATKKVYVGVTSNIHTRWNRHQRELKKRIHHSLFMQEVFDVYGLEDLVFTEGDIFTEKEEAYLSESNLIRSYVDKGLFLNIGIGGDSLGGDNLTLHPLKEDILEKRISSQKVYLDSLSVDDKKQIFGRQGSTNGMYGKSHTEDAKKSISDKNKGNSYAKGSVRSDEVKAKLSAAASQRVGEKNHFFGKHHSEESREKIRQINKGRKPVNMVPVSIDDATYESVTEASRQLLVCPATIIYRIKSKHFPRYFYLNA